MDNFMNIAKEGYQAYEGMQGGGNQGGGNQNQQQQYQQNNQDQGDYNTTGGAQWNSSNNQPGGGQYQPSNQGQQFQHGTGQRVGPDVDADQAIQNANQHAGGAGDSGMFGQAMSFLHQNPDQHTQPVNEQHVLNAHDQAYNQGNSGSLSASSLGGAAAMQALKKFTGGGGGGGGGGGNNQTQLISMAMGEAAKLFESQGASSGNKQDAVNGAAMTVMKLMVQSKFGGGGGGMMGGGSSMLMGMASKFL